MQTFIYKGKQVEYPLLDKFAAMKKANEDLVWSDKDSLEGAWFPTTKVNTYQWIDGNFFD